MIKFQDLVPSVYTSASRDFQYMGWLINVVLNSVKHNVDGLYELPVVKNDQRLIELLATTLGFKVKRSYDQEQLAALVNALPIVLKYKGTLKAVEAAGNALIKAAGINDMFECDFNAGTKTLEVTLPPLVDATLLTDLIPYILPAGTTCRITRKSQKLNKYITEVTFGDTLHAKAYDELYDAKAGKITLAGMFDVGKSTPVFTNYLNKDNDAQSELNVGLLNNTVIPNVYDTKIETKYGSKTDES